MSYLLYLGFVGLVVGYMYSKEVLYVSAMQTFLFTMYAIVNMLFVVILGMYLFWMFEKRLHSKDPISTNIILMIVSFVIVCYVIFGIRKEITVPILLLSEEMVLLILRLRKSS